MEVEITHKGKKIYVTVNGKTVDGSIKEIYSQVRDSFGADYVVLVVSYIEDHWDDLQ